MRKWTKPQSQCIFCAFTAARPSRSSLTFFSASYNTSVSLRQRVRGDENQQVASRDPEQHKRKRYSPGFRIKHGVARPQFVRNLDNPLVINQELEDVRKRLTESDYDCDGALWESFRNEVAHAATVDRHSLIEPEATLLDNLEKARLEGRVQTFLQGLFIDRFLESQGHNVSEQMSHVADLRYPTEWYTKARSTQRDIHLHIGPTNSGKTYNALKRLEESGNGFYAGPLRLLAHEVYSRFKAKGLKCDLITGDDVRVDEEGARLKASTVEMASLQKGLDVAVIDEIQMMADPDRGWAWTRAFLGACAKEVHLCGETRVKPLVQELVASMGDKLHIHEYRRLNELRCMTTSLEGDLTNLQPGDAVVSFSIVGIHAMKKAIEKKTGRRCAVVYGSLPPETRAQQAALFNDPDNTYDFLVASDAIGMGLNLSIKRVIFESVHKFDGFSSTQLSVSSIKQIAGRAGRFRTARDAAQGESVLKGKRSKDGKSIGLVTTLFPKDLTVVREALAAEAPPITTASIMPPGEFIVDLAARLPKNTPHEYILQRLSEAAAVHPRFALSNLRDQTSLARIIEPVQGLTTEERHIFSAAPFAYRGNAKDRGSLLAYELAQRLGQKKSTSIVDLKWLPLEYLQEPLREHRDFLHQLESLHQGLILYLWLSYRMSAVYKDQAMAFHAKTMVEERINLYLETYTSAKGLQVRKFMAREEGEKNPRTKDLSQDTADPVAQRSSPKAREAESDARAEEVGGDALNPLPTFDPSLHDPALPVTWDRQSLAGQDSAPDYDGEQEQQRPEKAAGSG